MRTNLVVQPFDCQNCFDRMPARHEVLRLQLLAGAGRKAHAKVRQPFIPGAGHAHLLRTILGGSRIMVSSARKARENLLQCHVLGAKKETSASRVRSAGLLLAEHFFVARKNATPRFNSEVRSPSGVITWTGLPDSRPSQTFNCSGELVTNLPCFETGIRSSAHLRTTERFTQELSDSLPAFKHLGLAFRFG